MQRVRFVRQQGFTMVELVVVVVVMSVLLMVGAVLIHPADYGPQRRNAARWLYAVELNYALQSYREEHGALPALPDKLTTIGSDNGQLDLCQAFVPAYLVELPLDPTGGASVNESPCDTKNVGYTTGIQIKRSTDGTVTIHMPHAELGERITYIRKY